MAVSKALMMMYEMMVLDLRQVELEGDSHMMIMKWFWIFVSLNEGDLHIQLNSCRV
jgi:hypothetical protein